jgi:ceramide glucosyltransferase
MSVGSVLDLLLAISSAIYLVGVASGWHHLEPRVARLPPPQPLAWPAVTLIKPLAGLEEGLERNLISLFAQSYNGRLEVVFSSANEIDPAWPVARRIAACFPAIPVRFVIAPRFGLNPGLSNVAAAVRAARHDLILHSDANTLFRPDSLAYLVADFVNTGAGILSCAVVGEGERSLWAAVENAQLTVFTAPAMCFASGPAGNRASWARQCCFAAPNYKRLAGSRPLRICLPTTTSSAASTPTLESWSSCHGCP